MSFAKYLFPLAAAPLLAGGCAYGELRQVLRADVAAELDCPSMSIEPRNSEALRGSRDGDDQWKLRGCEVVRTYTCAAEGGDMVPYGGHGCSYVDGDVDAPKVASMEDDDGMLGDGPSEAELETDMDSDTDADDDAGDMGDDMDDDTGSEDDDL